MHQCEQRASLLARRLGSTSRLSVPTIVGGANGAATVIMPSPMPAHDAIAEHDFLGDCLRSKGYTLVPLK